MSDIDPLSGTIEQLRTALSPQPAMARGDAATVSVGPDGSLCAIRLTATGRRLAPDTLADEIVRLHAEAFAQVRRTVADAVARLERDPRLLAQRERVVDALEQPRPRQSPDHPRPHRPRG